MRNDRPTAALKMKPDKRSWLDTGRWPWKLAGSQVMPLAWLILATGAGLRIWLIFGVKYFEEDALITLRYADNIVAGHGWVYNDGERVLGTTSPLWTLVTLVSTPLPVSAARMVLATLCLTLFCLASAWLVTALSRQTAFNGVGIIVLVSILALHGVLVPVSVGGMESSLFVLLIVGAISLTHLSPAYGFAAAGLATLTRPEGLVLLIAMSIVLAIMGRQPRRWGLAIGSYLIVLAPWLLFATWYFGSPIPQSAMAKSGWFGEDISFGALFWRPADLYKLIVEFSGTRFGLAPGPVQITVTLMACTLFVVGVLAAYRRRNLMLLTLALFFLGYVAFFYFGRGALFPWYPLPPIVAFWAPASYGAGLALRDHWRSSCAVTGGLLVILLLQLTIRLPKAIELQRYEDTVRQPAGEWLAACSDSRATVMLEPLGYVGYYSDRYVYDVAGLVSPEFVELIAEGGRGWPARAIGSERPDFVVLRAYEVPSNEFAADGDEPIFSAGPARKEFHASYQRVAEFGAGRTALVIYSRFKFAGDCPYKQTHDGVAN